LASVDSTTFNRYSPSTSAQNHEQSRGVASREPLLSASPVHVAMALLAADAVAQADGLEEGNITLGTHSTRDREISVPPSSARTLSVL
jgi:hypothetical protein